MGKLSATNFCVAMFLDSADVRGGVFAHLSLAPVSLVWRIIQVRPDLHQILSLWSCRVLLLHRLVELVR